MEPWVVALKDEVEKCTRENWDVRIIERIENRDRLEIVVNNCRQFDQAAGYQVKAAVASEGLPFLNLLITGDTEASLALDDPIYRLARMGLNVVGHPPQSILRAYWDDLWDRCPYWVRKQSGLFEGAGGIGSLRERFERSIHNPAFVAMWFGDNNAVETQLYMLRVYEDHVRPSIERAGYEAARVDLVPHNDFIMDRVLHLIRSAPFVVADFTGNRNGVYLEAGYARGVGIPVIHTCKTEHFPGAHFDIKQINTLSWQAPNDIDDALTKRILETVGAGPRLATR